MTSVGSKGDCLLSYDNALAETVNGLYKTELIHPQAPWRTVDDLELATAGWVHWWNTARLHSACGHLPPAEPSAVPTMVLSIPDGTAASWHDTFLPGVETVIVAQGTDFSAPPGRARSSSPSTRLRAPRAEKNPDYWDADGSRWRGSR